MSLPIPQRDQEALDAFQRAKAFLVPTATVISEHDTEQGVFTSLARVLEQLSARVENETDEAFKEVRFAGVFVDEPLASTKAVYPAAYIESVSTNELAASNFVPVTEKDCDGDTVDMVTDEHALWMLGEDTGEANVKIFTTTEVEARALAQAVRDLLTGNVDDVRSCVLPMPVRSLPPPFRDRFPVERTPACALTLNNSRGQPAPGAEDGVWVVDVEFGWRALRYIARPRIADFRPFVTVTTEP